MSVWIDESDIAASRIASICCLLSSNNSEDGSVYFCLMAQPWCLEDICRISPAVAFHSLKGQNILGINACRRHECNNWTQV